MVRRLAAILGAAVLWLAPAAAEAVNVKINEPLVRITAKPGEVVTGRVTVANNDETAVKLKVYLQDWAYVSPGQGDKVFAPANTTPLACASWINYAPQEIELAPRSQQTVDYTLRVPSDATGGRYTVLFFESDLGMGPKPGAQGVAVTYSARIGSLFFVEVAGTAQRRGAVQQLEVIPPKAQQPLKLDATFANQGNVAIVAEGFFNLLDSRGQVMAREKLTTGYTFPGTQARMTGEWWGTLAPGRYTVVVTLDLGDDVLIVEERPLEMPSTE